MCPLKIFSAYHDYPFPPIHQIFTVSEVGPNHFHHSFSTTHEKRNQKCRIKSPRVCFRQGYIYECITNALVDYLTS